MSSFPYDLLGGRVEEEIDAPPPRRPPRPVSPMDTPRSEEDEMTATTSATLVSDILATPPSSALAEILGGKKGGGGGKGAGVRGPPALEQAAGGGEEGEPPAPVPNRRGGKAADKYAVQGGEDEEGDGDQEGIDLTAPSVRAPRGKQARMPEEAGDGDASGGGGEEGGGRLPAAMPPGSLATPPKEEAPPAPSRAASGKGAAAAPEPLQIPSPNAPPSAASGSGGEASARSAVGASTGRSEGRSARSERSAGAESAVSGLSASTQGSKAELGHAPSLSKNWGGLKLGMKKQMALAETHVGVEKSGAGGLVQAALAAAAQKDNERAKLKANLLDPKTPGSAESGGSSNVFAEMGSTMEKALQRKMLAKQRQSQMNLNSPSPKVGGDGSSAEGLGGVPEDEDEDDEEEYGKDHTRLLYLISCYTGTDGTEDTWVRKVPLLVFIYEGIVNGVYDYDYAPAPDIVGGKRTYLNISQEGRDDLDDLREGGLLYGLKLSSKKYQSTVALRITSLGHLHLEQNMTLEDKEAVDSLIYAPNSDNSPEDLLRVRWDMEDLKFVLWSENGHERESTITDIESVSYVSSPYIPRVLRLGGRECNSNEDRIEELKNAVSNIKDELDENLTLNNVHLLIGEWLPMGANQIVALNDKLGSSERVQGGFFTAVVDNDPDSSTFKGESEGLSEVDILDFDETTYVNFEAEVHFPEEEGIVQVENFGIHINDEGFLIYGMRTEGIMHAIRNELSLDNLSRLLVDVHVDSSKIVDNLLSPHQRIMLDLTYLNDAAHRDKYNIILCERINPLMVAEKYMDKEDNENELKQVIGDTYAAHDLETDGVLVIGKNGIIVAAPQILKYEEIVVLYLSLMTRNMFMRSLFQRTFILTDVLKNIRHLIDSHESNPNSISIIRNLLSESSGDIILLTEIQSYLLESLAEMEIPTDDFGDKGVGNMMKILNLQATLTRLKRRVQDMKKNISGAKGEVDALRDMADVVSESREFRVQEAVQANTKNLEDVFRANERASASLEIMQVVLAGSLAFDIIDRVHGLYMGIAPDIEWSIEWMEPIYNTPGMLFLVNMAWWGVVGGFIKWLMYYIGKQAAGVMSVRYKVNCKVDGVAMKNYLSTKSVEVEDSDSDKTTFVKKYTWDETGNHWKGQPPKVEIMVDDRYYFLLKVFIQVNTSKSSITQDEVRENFFGELRDHGVIEGQIEGIEYLPDEDESEEEDEEVDEEDLDDGDDDEGGGGAKGGGGEEGGEEEGYYEEEEEGEYEEYGEEDGEGGYYDEEEDDEEEYDPEELLKN